MNKKQKKMDEKIRNFIADLRQMTPQTLKLTLRYFEEEKLQELSSCLSLDEKIFIAVHHQPFPQFLFLITADIANGVLSHSKQLSQLSFFSWVLRTQFPESRPSHQALDHILFTLHANSDPIPKKRQLRFTQLFLNYMQLLSRSEGNYRIPVLLQPFLELRWYFEIVAADNLHVHRDKKISLSPYCHLPLDTAPFYAKLFSILIRKHCSFFLGDRTMEGFPPRFVQIVTDIKATRLHSDLMSTLAEIPLETHDTLRASIVQSILQQFTEWLEPHDFRMDSFFLREKSGKLKGEQSLLAPVSSTSSIHYFPISMIIQINDLAYLLSKVHHRTFMLWILDIRFCEFWNYFLFTTVFAGMNTHSFHTLCETVVKNATVLVNTERAMFFRHFFHSEIRGYCVEMHLNPETGCLLQDSIIGLVATLNSAKKNIFNRFIIATNYEGWDAVGTGLTRLWYEQMLEAIVSPRTNIFVQDEKTEIYYLNSPENLHLEEIFPTEHDHVSFRKVELYEMTFVFLAIFFRSFLSAEYQCGIRFASHSLWMLLNMKTPSLSLIQSAGKEMDQNWHDEILKIEDAEEQKEQWRLVAEKFHYQLSPWMVKDDKPTFNFYRMNCILDCISPQFWSRQICGVPRCTPLNIYEWKKNIVWQGKKRYPEAQEEWLTRWMTSISPQAAKDFFFLTTSRKTVPNGEFSQLAPKWSCQFDETLDVALLPSSQTCFHIIVSPVYATEALLIEKFNKFIEWAGESRLNDQTMEQQAPLEEEKELDFFGDIDSDDEPLSEGLHSFDLSLVPSESEIRRNRIAAAEIRRNRIAAAEIRRNRNAPPEIRTYLDGDAVPLGPSPQLIPGALSILPSYANDLSPLRWESHAFQ